jgi:hypothetical protein
LPYPWATVCALRAEVAKQASRVWVSTWVSASCKQSFTMGASSEAFTFLYDLWLRSRTASAIACARSQDLLLLVPVHQVPGHVESFGDLLPGQAEAAQRNISGRPVRGVRLQLPPRVVDCDERAKQEPQVGLLDWLPQLGDGRPRGGLPALRVRPRPATGARLQPSAQDPPIFTGVQGRIRITGIATESVALRTAAVALTIDCMFGLSVLTAPVAA